jgi:hypothetical protein
VTLVEAATPGRRSINRRWPPLSLGDRAAPALEVRQHRRLMSVHDAARDRAQAPVAADARAEAPGLRREADAGDDHGRA